MRKIILIVHTSIDGFVAGKRGEFDDFNPSPENLDFICSLTDEADTALMGRVSYQMLQSAWPDARNKPDATQSEIKYSNWYNDAQKIVISNSMTGTDLHNTTIINGNIADKILHIKKQEGKSILMFGGPTAFQLLNELNLIDEFWVIVYPVIFGQGIPFSPRAMNLKRLKLLTTKQLSNGEIAIKYQSASQ